MAKVPGSAEALAGRAHEWLVGLDPATFPADDVPEARRGLVAVRALLPAARADLEASVETVRLLHELSALEEVLPDPASVGELRTDWLDVRVAVAPLYETFAIALKKAGGRARHLHPMNWRRSLVHVASGLLVVAAFELVFTPTTGFLTALAFTVWAWSLELARRRSAFVNRLCMRFFGPIARDHERYRVNSATWYGTALLILSITSFGPAGVLGLLALAIGDPTAGIVGRSYGEIRVWGGKSLEGMVAFALSTTLVGYVYLLALHQDLAGSFTLLGWALLAGVTGAVVELLSTRLEDNFTIPVVTAWVVGILI